ncbi:asparagine synthase-related protein [Spirosoma sp. SC4-14]|uniref:asparagine synthetase B family protein n=1 Tax=Spirosoma sp. SC4-14 TaxID=3128900 RepID=UPI0030CA845F
MSGIAGIVRFDQQAVARNDVEALLSRLKHRGTSVIQAIENGLLVSFGGLLETESDTKLYAVADADIFGRSAIKNPFITTYRNNHQDSFNELNADFAVAVWNERRQTITCVRDPLGVKPLYYVFQPGRFFAFASEIKALLDLTDVAITPNYTKFREYLTWATTYVPYGEATFYEGIYSVLPGHSLEVTHQTLHTSPYWNLNLSPFKGLDRAADYANLFRTHFTEAIDQRMRSRKTIGAHLSGGLDSSSVSSIAQHLLTQQHRPALHTFNIDTGLASTDESTYVQAVVDQYHTSHQAVRPLQHVLDSILEINRIFDRPDHFIIPSSFHLSVSRAARQVNCDLILTGHDGDSVITPGFDYFDELIELADWERLRMASQQFTAYADRNLRYVTPNWNQLSDQAKYEKHILYLIGPTLKKQLKEQRATQFMGTFRQQKQTLGLSWASIMGYLSQRIRDKWAHKALLDTVLNAEFRQQTATKSQQSTQKLTDSLSSEHQVPVKPILNLTNVICNEQLNHIGAYYGHQYSFPFFDKNVMALGLATPLAVEFDNGRGRGLIRNGLQTILPHSISTRLTKANFVEYGNLSARQLYEATHEQFSATSHPIWEVIDRQRFSQIKDFVFDGRIDVTRKTRYNWLLSRSIYLALWLGALRGKP